MIQRSLVVLLALFGFFGTSPAWSAESVFTTALERIAAQEKVAILVEGSPLDPDAHRSEITALIGQGGSPMTQLRKVGELFDYEVSLHRGVYLFSKRYSDRRDMPCVTLGELRAYVAECRLVIHTVAPRRSPLPFEKPFQDFIASLSDEELRRMSGDGLTTDELSGPARKAFGVIITEGYIGGARYPADAFVMIFNNPSKAFLSTDSKYRVGLVYNTPLQNGSDLKMGLADGGIFFEEPKGITKDSFRWAVGSLGEQIAERDGRAGEGKITCADELRDKPLFVAGGRYADNQQIAAGVCQLYGLRLSARGGGWHVSRPAPVRASTAAGAGNALWRMTPLPLRKSVKNDFSVPVQTLLTAFAPEVRKADDARLAFAALSPRMQTAVGLYFLAIFWREVRDLYGRPPAFLTSGESLLLRCKLMPGKGTEFSILRRRNGEWKSVSGYRTGKDLLPR